MNDPQHIRFSASKGIIHFGGDVSHAAAAELFCALTEMRNRPVSIVINSYGGDVDASFACYDAIRSYPGKTRAAILGTCQSAATLIFLACDVRYMSPNSTLMIHEGDQALGRLHPREFEAQAAAMQRAGDRFNALVAERTGLSLRRVEQLSTFATYMSADEALSLGFASSTLASGASKRRTGSGNSARAKAKCSRQPVASARKKDK